MSRWVRILSILLIGLCGVGVAAQSSGIAIIEGYVLDAATGQPVVGAEVVVRTEDDSLTLRTSDRGYFNGSLLVEGESQHAAVSVSAAGYGRWTMLNTAVYAEQSRIFPAILLRGSAQTIDAGGSTTAFSDGETLPPPEYLQGTSQFQRALPDDARDFWSHDILPTTINVALTGYRHCGRYINGSYVLYPVTEVRTVEFNSYVKGVIPNEWLSSWDQAALRAGGVAAKMYAWWKINIGPRGTFEGKDYDVRADTCDQVYVPNSERSSTNEAIDLTWNWILRSNERVSRLHYTDRVSTCERVGLSPCMGQWDSQDMAEDGASWQEILLYFYEGFDLSLASDELPMSPSNENLVVNGDFDQDAIFWSNRPGTDYAVYDEGAGKFLAWKGREGATGVMSQMLNYSIPAGSVAEVSLELGNTSSVEKRVRVYLHQFTGGAPVWSGAAMCEFTLAPDTPLSSHVMRYRVPATWDNTRLWLEGTPVDNQPDILTDSVRVSRYDTLNQRNLGCFAPVSQTDWWDFSGAGSPYGWISGSDSLHNPALNGDGIQYTITDDDPHLLGPSFADIDAANYRYVFVKMRSTATNCGAISFTTPGQQGFQATQRVDFDIIPDGTMRDYLVDMSANTNWTGAINRLRLDVACDDHTTDETITIERVILWDSAEPPRAPAPIMRQSPANGTEVGFNDTVTLVWQPDTNAEWYHIYLGNADGTVLDQWVEGTQVCDETSCTYPDDLVLAAGGYDWWMAAWGIGGMGAYNQTTFDVSSNKPGAIVRETPQDPLTWSGLTWEHRPDTVWYHVYLMRDGNVILNRWYEAKAICDEAAVCAVPEAGWFVNGTYDWWMAGWNPNGTGEYTNTPFALALAVPDRVSRTIPATPARTTLPWVRDPKAAWYHVYLARDDEPIIDKWFDADEICDDAICEIDARTLENGSYRWWMAAWGPGGMGNYDEVAFVIGLAAPEAIPRVNPIDSATVIGGLEALQWSDVAGVAWYHVQLSGPGVERDQWVDGAVVCMDETCTLEVNITTPGSYTWTMKSWGPGGIGIEDSITFTVE